MPVLLQIWAFNLKSFFFGFRGHEGSEGKAKGKDEAKRARVSSQARFGEGESSKEVWNGGQ